MANCNKLFIDFDSKLNITSSKKKDLKQSRKELRRKVKDYFSENHPGFSPVFFTQGSIKLGTMIRNSDDLCDLDDGIYFKGAQPEEVGKTIQGWVYDAIHEHTDGGAQHRKKCIRVYYKNLYHIDLPVYYMADTDAHPHIAVKDDGWQLSDPKEFIEWFIAEKDDQGQLVRLIKYLKSWCDTMEHKMPSGLCMTVLAQRNFTANVRDDIGLRNLLLAIESDITNEWKCLMPTVPYDDLLAKYTEALKKNFLACISTFIADATKAIEEKSQLTASELWTAHLGQRFPVGIDEDSDAKEAKLRSLTDILAKGVAATSPTVAIVNRADASAGVNNQTHRFYGEVKA